MCGLKDVGQCGDEVTIPQERLGKGLPEATPAAVNNGEPGSWQDLGWSWGAGWCAPSATFGCGELGVSRDKHRVAVPCSPLCSVDETWLLLSWNYLFQKKGGRLTLV